MSATTTRLASLIERLALAVGTRHVITDPEIMAAYERDWTGRWPGTAAAVIRPGSTSEVAAVVAACAEARVAIVPQGGNTGLVGGSSPVDGSVVVSTARLTAIGEVDASSNELVAGAGVTLALLQASARTAGLRFPVDIASRETCTVGGMIATNAGGVHVIRYGSMRDQVAGIEVVLADGRVLSQLSSAKQAGYGLAGMFCGSEGTLGLVTSARLRLRSALEHRVTVMAGVDGIGSALELLHRVRRLASLEAAELMFGDGLEVVRRHCFPSASVPVAGPCALLLEFADATDPTESLYDLIAPLVADEATIVATDATARRVLWAWRDRLPEALSRLGVPHKFDISVPHRRLEEFVRAVRSELSRRFAAAQCFVWGHLGEGNLHVNVVGVDALDSTVDDVVLSLAVAHDGSVCAEHGVGRAKVDWFMRTRPATETAVFAAAKAALDPTGVFNPGVMVPARHVSTRG